ncbi:MAG: hypothetical protein A3E87_04980 [Gammaproteobacteria bacterium RIFCSPHIGHO2_12_FULL_35_23]|nr:MAG: hypothetical protein A3E87_04980 [Gammaproteobacteria bacterium RIFCSPHIGHO2_12_FULL_35_23]
MIYIIGSGPSGVATAKALLARGIAVTMIDAGVELEKSKQLLLNSLQVAWRPEVAKKLKHNIHQEDNVKLSYGSDYPYQQVDKVLKIISDKNIYCKPSLAKGGLSTIWGAFNMPYASEDIHDWPFPISYLEPYYKKVLEFMPLAASKFDSTNSAPLYTDQLFTYQHSKQADILLQHMSAHKQNLFPQGFEYGSARLAVSFNSLSGLPHCSYCGYCQHGCPYQIIYSSQDTLRELEKEKNFTYIKNILVSKLIENKAGIIIKASHLHSGNELEFYGKQVFLAAGAVFSTKILLASLNLYNKPVLLKDSQHFMFPCFLYKATSKVKSEKLHTLAQAYIKLTEKNILSNRAHFEVFTYMDHYESQFKKIFKLFYPLVQYGLTPVLNRMLILQGFLHSQDSEGCLISLQEDNKTIKLQQYQFQADEKLKQIGKYLFKHRRLLGFFPVWSFLQVSKIMRSYHYGGSFPMSKNKDIVATDLLGKPYGFTRLHVVDATVFPSIPAHAITLSIMANAYRIANECNIYE